MSYGSPSLAEAISKLLAQDITNLVVLPLYVVQLIGRTDGIGIKSVKIYPYSDRLYRHDTLIITTLRTQHESQHYSQLTELVKTPL
jgi:protoheme ferro-lyase